MAGTINDFRSSFKTDLARPARFDVTINIPYVLLPFITTARNLTYRCENADLPGRNFATIERKIGTVPTQKVPYQTVYNESNMTFIVGGDMNEKMLFDTWMDVINPTSNYNFKYKKDYVTDITINQYDLTNKLTYQAVLLDAFPIAVNQLDLDWASDGHHKLTVSFAYSSWTQGAVSIGDNIKSQILSGLDDSLNNLLAR